MKAKIFSIFSAMLLSGGVASAATVYQPVVQQQNGYYGYQQAPAQYTTGYVPVNAGSVPTQYAPTGYVAQTAQPTRVSGSVPNIGKSASNQRKYYDPGMYDRLADSGLYIGLGVGYSVSTMGGMQADGYDTYSADSIGPLPIPGAAAEADFKTDTVIPFSVSLGAAINSEFRIDFSYTRYSGISYPDEVKTDVGGFMATVPAYDGSINASTTMLNLYYNLDAYMGNMLGGKLHPYVGAGIGFGQNTISDYMVYDAEGYNLVTDQTQPGDLTAVNNITAYHSGGTTENFTYMLEGGVTTDLSGGLKLDLFARYMGLGNVESSGSVVVTQDEWTAGPMNGGSDDALYTATYHYTNAREKGSLSSVDIGARLRIQF